jgi:hypothetical protein
MTVLQCRKICLYLSYYNDKILHLHFSLSHVDLHIRRHGLYTVLNISQLIPISLKL